MPESKASYFTWNDIEHWVADGLITSEQALAIQEQVEQQGEFDEDLPAPREQKPGLNMVTVAYYMGSLTILLAYTFFMGLHWQSMGYPTQFAVSAITAGMLWVGGALLRRYDLPTAGGLLIFAGTGITPLICFTLAQVLGIWPQTPDYNDAGYQDFYQTIRPYWVYLEVVSLLAAALVIWLIRFPLIMLLIAFWGWYLSMDLARWVTQSLPGYDDREQILSVLVGALMLLIGIVLQYRTREDYSRWLYLFGHLVLIGNLAILTYSKEGVLGLLFIILYAGFVVSSVWLQRPVFLVFGALGCYGYVSYLAFRTFSGAAGFPIALALIGLSIVLSAVAYQKYVRGWLDERLEKYRLDAPPVMKPPLASV